jgi:hypothetical protein
MPLAEEKVCTWIETSVDFEVFNDKMCTYIRGTHLFIVWSRSIAAWLSASIFEQFRFDYSGYSLTPTQQIGSD